MVDSWLEISRSPPEELALVKNERLDLSIRSLPTAVALSVHSEKQLDGLQSGRQSESF